MSALFRIHHRRLVGLAALLVDDRATAEDVVQDAFAGLYQRWWLLRDPDSATAYLNRAVINRGRDELRHGRRVATLQPRMTPRSGSLDSAEREALDHDESEQLWAAVQRLPRRQRQVIVLRYYLDQRESEIAELLGISSGSVKTHATRGLAALGRSLEDAR